MTAWRYECSHEWCRARKGLLTASVVPSLVADWKRWRKDPDALLPQFSKAAGEALSRGIDPTSTGAAARGHVLEPYAVEELAHAHGPELAHVDDVVISDGEVGWSPDATDREFAMRLDGSATWPSSKGGPTVGAEVKCYGAGAHFQRAARLASMGRQALDERWQCACAFVAAPSLRQMWLVFYAPQASSLEWCLYERDDLLLEIEAIDRDMRTLFGREMARLRKRTERSLLHTEEEIARRFEIDNQG